MSTVKKPTKQQQLKISKLISDFTSGDDLKIGAAIKSLEIHGDASVIDPLVRLWNNGLSVENERIIHELFVGLKDTSTIEPLMEAFRNSEFESIRRKLVGAFWNSKLDFSPYLADFVLFAIEGDFLDAFEAFTLIEQFETKISDSAVMESQLLMREYFGSSEFKDASKNSQKDTILSDIALFLKQLDDADGTEDLFFDEEE